MTVLSHKVLNEILNYLEKSINNLAADGADNLEIDGYFIGTGFKSLINNNLYGFIEVNYFKFNNDTYGGNYNNGSPINFDVDAKIDATNLKLGLGYQF